MTSSVGSFPIVNLLLISVYLGFLVLVSVAATKILSIAHYMEWQNQEMLKQTALLEHIARKGEASRQDADRPTP